MKNRVLSFFDKQQGFLNDLTYDYVLPRLSVRSEDAWNGINPSIYGSNNYNPEPPILSAKFANCDNFPHMLAIANEDGKIALHNTKVNANTVVADKSLHGHQCHFNAVFDLEWVPGQMRFVSASGDHNARMWDITESDLRLLRVFSGHTRSVKVAAYRRTDSAVFATGGRDGAILIWDTRAALNCDFSPRADNCIYSGHVGGPGTPISHKRKARQTPKIPPNGASSSITGLVFQDDFTLVSCGAGDGIIKVWDLRRNYSCYKKEPLPKFSLPYAGTSTFNGFTNLLMDKSGCKLYANCIDNTIYSYNLSSYSTKPMQRYVGLLNSTFYIKSCLSPDGNYLVSGSSDEKAYIWNVENPEPLVTLHGHTVEVTCVAWSDVDSMAIVTCSDDARHKIWRIGPERIANDEKQQYRGHAELWKKEKPISMSLLKTLEHTPRSLRRITEKNEKTPNSVEKTSNKRSASDMNDAPCCSAGPSNEAKRLHLESKGRRLFSPTANSHAISKNRISSTEAGVTYLEQIPEETENLRTSSIVNHPEDSNQENSLVSHIEECPPSTSDYGHIKSISPLSERINFNVNSASTSTAYRASTSSASSSAALFSPTSNLPNFVVDGDAPHLHVMSPKRKAKDKIDWLTKMRKQKLMLGRTTTLSEKISTHTNFEEARTSATEVCLSPRLHCLRTSENSTAKLHETPKRPQITGSESIDSAEESSSLPRPRTPTSGRRNSETSILRFFTKSATATSSGT